MKFPTPFIGTTENINVIIETPKGSRNKYAYDPETDLYKLTKTLPAGMSFPFEFGFIPNTKAEDGDPVDVLVMMDEPGYPGCLVECRVLGVIEAEQNEDGEIVRNDRIIAASVESYTFSSFKSIEDFDEKILNEITFFFTSYHMNDGNEFKALRNTGPEGAINLIKENYS
jgi:inorganic pyrophosphatase